MNYGISRVIDLDFKNAGERKESLIDYLDETIRNENGKKTIITGDLGTGKTISAKYLTSLIVEDYLRRTSDRIKIIYVDLKNYDIRTQTKDILRYELDVNCNLDQQCVNQLIKEYENDKIKIIFDSVDEMAKPYTLFGRQEVIKVLKSIGNNAASLYFLRSTYFKSDEELFEEFEKIIYLEDNQNIEEMLEHITICDLSDDQVRDLIESRIKSKTILDGINELLKSKFKNTLKDPLIISFVTSFLKESEKFKPFEFLRDLPVRRVEFLDYLLRGLLKREFFKREKHLQDTKVFKIFREFLYEVAFIMVCEEIKSFSIERWDSFVSSNVIERGSGKISEEEAVDFFRTMAWVHRDDRARLVTYRNELLVLICAARFIITYFRNPKSDLNREGLIKIWNHNSSESKEVLQYVSCLIEEKDLLSMGELLVSTSDVNIRRIIIGTFENIGELRPSKKSEIEVDQSLTLGKLGLCICEYPPISPKIMDILYRNLNPHRFSTIVFPLFGKLKDKFNQSQDRKYLISIRKLIPYLLECTRDWDEAQAWTNFGRQLRYMKKRPDEYFDKKLFKEMDTTQASLLSGLSYINLFNALLNDRNLLSEETKYIEKSLIWANKTQ